MAPSNDNKMWKKRYLIPLWVVQLIVLGIYFVLSIVGISAAEDLDDYLDSPEWNNRSDYADQVVYVLRSKEFPSALFQKRIAARVHKDCIN